MFDVKWHHIFASLHHAHVRTDQKAKVTRRTPYITIYSYNLEQNCWENCILGQHFSKHRSCTSSSLSPESNVVVYSKESLIPGRLWEATLNWGKGFSFRKGFVLEIVLLRSKVDMMGKTFSSNFVRDCRLANLLFIVVIYRMHFHWTW